MKGPYARAFRSNSLARLPRTNTNYPINLLRGSVWESATDLSLSGPAFGWSHVRTYDSRLVITDNVNIGEVVYGNGARWHASSSGPFLHEISLAGGYRDVELYVDAASKRVFKSDLAGGYIPPTDYHATLVEDTTAETMTITELDTEIVYVFDISGTWTGPLFGRLVEITTMGNVAQTPAPIDGTTYSYVSSGSSAGFVDTVTMPQGWQVDYTYFKTGAESGSLKMIEVKDGTGTVQQKVEYTYKETVDDLGKTAHADLGSTGDLVQVKVSKRSTTDTGTSFSIVRYTQYRYFNSSGTDGKTHQMKMVLESDAIARLVAAGIADPETILEKSDTFSVGGHAVSDYANRSFTYYVNNSTDTDNSVTTPWGSENLSTKYGGNDLNEYDTANNSGYVKTESINTGCAGCGGPSGGIIKEYFYMELNGGSSTDTNEVIQLVVEDTDYDGSTTPHKRCVYGLNKNGITLRKMVLDNPSNYTQVWCESTELNSNGLVLEKRMRSAHSGKVTTDALAKKFLDPTTGSNDSETVQASSGEVQHFEYETGGSNDYGDGSQVTGIRTSRGAVVTILNPKYYVLAIDWGRGGADEPEHLPLKYHEFTSATTNRADSSRNTTTFEYDFWDSGDTQIKTVTTELPIVSTSENGSGVATTTNHYFDELGRLRWMKGGRGYVNYYAHNPDTGGVAYVCRDVNPASTGTDIQMGSS
ncbi:MAG: hypothetical protein AAF497_04885, partial [Planctomycetota bacterium]